MVRLLAGALGVEPSSVVLETIILPMYYAPKIYYNMIAHILIICKKKIKYFYISTCYFVKIML